MDVILVCFHGYDIPIVLFCNVAAGSFNEIVNSVYQKDFTVFCDKDNMYFQAELAAIFTIVSVLHT